MELLEFLFQIIYTFFSTFITMICTPMVSTLLCVALIVYICIILKYRATTYYKQTKCSYFKLQKDIGRIGEYHTYLKLRKFEREGAKFLFNVYIPKDDEQTTEIDVLMISKKGVFVFESKNYSGWIFGSQNQKNWYQTLPVGKGRKSSKEHFLNPIMQNQLHIRCLKAFLNKDVPIYSVVVFSDRCTFKGVDVKSDEKVIHREDVFTTVASISQKEKTDCLAETEIKEIFDKLYPCSQVDDSVKEKHIADIKSKSSSKSIVKSVEAPGEEKTGDIDKIEIFEEQENIVADESTVEEANTNEICLEKDLVADEIPSETEQKQEEERVCPRCGGELVLRTATRGENAGNQFYGCSNYPKCRYLKEK